MFPSQPATHTKELQSIQLSVCRGQSTLPVSSLTATREYRDKTWSSVLLRNVVKPEDFDNSTSDDAFCALFLPSRHHPNTSPPYVAEILAHTHPEELTKVYNMPILNTTSSSRRCAHSAQILKVGLLPVLLYFPH